jgi:hypothetical protein
MRDQGDSYLTSEPSTGKGGKGSGSDLSSFKVELS